MPTRTIASPSAATRAPRAPRTRAPRTRPAAPRASTQATQPAETATARPFDARAAKWVLTPVALMLATVFVPLRWLSSARKSR